MKRHPRLRGLLLTGLALVVSLVAVGYLAPFWLIDHTVRLNLWRSGVQSHYVTVDGDRIHYLEAKPRQTGKPERPLLLIHGLGAKAEDWAPLLPALADRGYHVYALDLLGYGRSARPAAASFPSRRRSRSSPALCECCGYKVRTLADGRWAAGLRCGSRSSIRRWCAN